MSGSWGWSSLPGSYQPYQSPSRRETRGSKNERKAKKKRNHQTVTVEHRGQKVRVAPVGKFDGFG